MNKIAMFLTLKEYMKDLNIKADDFTLINGNKFIVIKVENIQEWDIALDISLEVFDDGDKNKS